MLSLLSPLPTREILSVKPGGGATELKHDLDQTVSVRPPLPIHIYDSIS